MTRDCRRHDTDRAGAGDQHIFAQQIERQRRVNRITERIKDRANVVADIIGQRHNVKRRQAQILCKRPLFIHADAARFGIEVELASARLARSLADQMPLARAALTH